MPVSGKGMPDQLTQQFLANAANAEKELPILALVDYDVLELLAPCSAYSLVTGLWSPHTRQLHIWLNKHAARRLRLVLELSFDHESCRRCSKSLSFNTLARHPEVFGLFWLFCLLSLPNPARTWRLFHLFPTLVKKCFLGTAMLLSSSRY